MKKLLISLTLAAAALAVAPSAISALPPCPGPACTAPTTYGTFSGMGPLIVWGAAVTGAYYFSQSDYGKALAARNDLCEGRQVKDGPGAMLRWSNACAETKMINSAMPNQPTFLSPPK